MGSSIPAKLRWRAVVLNTVTLQVVLEDTDFSFLVKGFTGPPPPFPDRLNFTQSDPTVPLPPFPMNRALLNPFASQDLPKGVEEILERDKATCVCFNRHGNLLAVGTAAGHVTLWDFDTRSVAATLETSRDEALRVLSVAFPAPANGSTLLVAYHPSTVRVFDTLSADVLCEISFEKEIVQVVPHPRNTQVAIVVLRDAHPLILHLRKGVYHVADLLFQPIRDPNVVILAAAHKEQYACLTAGNRFTPPKRPKNAFGNKTFSTLPDGGSSIKFSVLCAKEEFEDGVPTETKGARKKSPFCVAFTRSGDRILRGGPNGLVRSFKLERRRESTANVDKGNAAANGDKEIGEAGKEGSESAYPQDTEILTAACVSAVTVQGRAAVRAIVVSRKNGKVLVNSHDRCMRQFLREQVLQGELEQATAGAPVIEPVTTFTEIVNKTQCISACFSSDGEYVVGGMEGTEHKIHIWRTLDGHLELTLEGAREGVSQIQWHPLRGVIVSLGMGMGQVYIWAKNVTENWSAFATEFSELEANEEYVEAEDEFDLKEPEDEETRLRAREAAEAAPVDITSCENAGWFSSDSEKSDTYFYVPAVPIPDGSDSPPSLANDLINARMHEKRRPKSPSPARENGGHPIRTKLQDRKRSKQGGGRPGKRPKQGKRKSGSGDSSGGERNTSNGVDVDDDDSLMIPIKPQNDDSSMIPIKPKHSPETNGTNAVVQEEGVNVAVNGDVELGHVDAMVVDGEQAG